MANHPCSSEYNANRDYRRELGQCDFGTLERMKMIIRILNAPMDVLQAQGFGLVECPTLDMLLWELQNILSSVCESFEFHEFGGLEVILNYLKHQDPSLRGSASEVVATLLWNNLRSQRLFMEANGFEALFDIFSSDLDYDIRTKALKAIFSLIRYNKLAVTAFRLANGYEVLRDALTSKNLAFQRQALDFVYQMLQEDCEESKIMHELGYGPIIIELAYSIEAKVRKSALWGLLELARLMKLERNNNNSCNNTNNDDSKISKNSAIDLVAMKQLLQYHVLVIYSSDGEELNRAREYRVLVDTLWRTCFNEPSCLGKIGLLVLPGEDAVPSSFDREFPSPYRDSIEENYQFCHYKSSDSDCSTISTERYPPK